MTLRYDGWKDKDKKAFDNLSKNEQKVYSDCIHKEPQITCDVMRSVNEARGKLVGIENY